MIRFVFGLLSEILRTALWLASNRPKVFAAFAGGGVAFLVCAWLIAGHGGGKHAVSVSASPRATQAPQQKWHRSAGWVYSHVDMNVAIGGQPTGQSWHHLRREEQVDRLAIYRALPRPTMTQQQAYTLVHFDGMDLKEMKSQASGGAIGDVVPASQVRVASIQGTPRETTVQIFSGQVDETQWGPQTVTVTETFQQVRFEERGDAPDVDEMPTPEPPKLQHDVGVGAVVDARSPDALYKRLGGQEAIVAIVHELIGNVSADGLINKRFAKTDLKMLEGSLVNQLCEATGGPCKYSGKSMADAHRHMNITAPEFAAFTNDLTKAFDKVKVPVKEQGELLHALDGMKSVIVSNEETAPALAIDATDTVEQAATQVEDDSVTPARAVELAKAAFARFGKVAGRKIAVAANSRGHRLLQAGELDDALPLLLEAVAIDATYGMPRYNAAHVYVLKGDLDTSLIFLKQLKTLGKPQRARLDQSKQDPDFKPLQDDPRYQALFE